MKFKCAVAFVLLVTARGDACLAREKARILHLACAEQRNAGEFPWACVRAMAGSTVPQAEIKELNRQCLRSQDVEGVSSLTLRRWLSWPHWVKACRSRLERALRRRQYQGGSA